MVKVESSGSVQQPFFQVVQFFIYRAMAGWQKAQLILPLVRWVPLLTTLHSIWVNSTSPGYLRALVHSSNGRMIFPQVPPQHRKHRTRKKQQLVILRTRFEGNDGSFKTFLFARPFTRSSINDPLFPRNGSRITLSIQATLPYSKLRNNPYTIQPKQIAPRL